MSEWLMQIALIVFGAVLLGVLIYSLVFSRASIERENKTEYGGYERREPERVDRRKRKAAPPPEVGERRQGPRRDS